jgi:hypothetical protein
MGIPSKSMRVTPFYLWLLASLASFNVIAVAYGANASEVRVAQAKPQAQAQPKPTPAAPQGNSGLSEQDLNTLKEVIEQTVEETVNEKFAQERARQEIELQARLSEVDDIRSRLNQLMLLMVIFIGGTVVLLRFMRSSMVKQIVIEVNRRFEDLNQSEGHLQQYTDMARQLVEDLTAQIEAAKTERQR